MPGFWIGVLHPDDRERVAQAVWRALRERDPCEIEYRAVAADGSVVRLKDRVKVIPDPDGAGLLLQGAITDLTSRSGGRAALRSRAPRRWRRGRYSGPIAGPAGPVVIDDGAGVETPPARASVFAPDVLLSRLGEAVIASDAGHRIVYWNAAAESLFGVPAESVIGQPDSDVLRTRTNAGQTAEILAGLMGRRPWSAEVDIPGAGGQAIPARITAVALRNGEGILGYVAVITDLRDVRRAEAVRGAAAAMDAVARLARGVAVELNEGVQAIEAAVRTALARVGPTDPVRGRLDEALRTVDATAALASQLLAVGRGLSTRPQRTDLGDVVRRGLPAIQLLAGDAIEIVTELDLGTPPALVDPAIASQILLNLSANSLSAMSRGGRLSISTLGIDLVHNGLPGVPPGAPSGPWVVLEVRDTRELSDAHELDRLFEPFSEEVSPPGMGLAAAHGLAVLANGHLTAAPARAGGLIFRLFVPPAVGSPG